jgi:hypothetical protein
MHQSRHSGKYSLAEGLSRRRKVDNSVERCRALVWIKTPGVISFLPAREVDGSDPGRALALSRVAFDLSQLYPTVRNHLVKKLADDRDIPMTANINSLFRQIVQEPLESSDGIIPAIVIVDALDGYGSLDGKHSQYRMNVLRTLSTWSLLARRLNIVIMTKTI